MLEPELADVLDAVQNGAAVAGTTEVLSILFRLLEMGLVAIDPEAPGVPTLASRFHSAIEAGATVETRGYLVAVSPV